MGIGHGEMGRLVLSGAVGAASRREVWGDGEKIFPSANAQSPMPHAQ